MADDALHFVEEAIHALTLEMWRGTGVDDMQKVTGPECTIAAELDRVDRAIGPKGTSMFANLAENVTQCVIALYAARDALLAARQKGQADE